MAAVKEGGVRRGGLEGRENSLKYCMEVQNTYTMCYYLSLHSNNYTTNLRHTYQFPIYCTPTNSGSSDEEGLLDLFKCSDVCGHEVVFCGTASKQQLLQNRR